MVEIAALAVMGVLAGMIAGLFGVGGGTVFVPTLTLVVGLSEIHAVGTSLLAIVPLAVLGTWQQRRAGDVRLRDAALMGAAATVTSVAGAVVADRLPETVLRYGLAAVIALIAVRLALGARRAERARRAPGELPAP